MQNLVKTEIPKRKKREKKKEKKRKRQVLISLAQGWYLKHRRISEKFLTFYCSNVAISTSQG